MLLDKGCVFQQVEPEWGIDSVYLQRTKPRKRTLWAAKRNARWVPGILHKPPFIVNSVWEHKLLGHLRLCLGKGTLHLDLCIVRNVAHLVLYLLHEVRLIFQIHTAVAHLHIASPPHLLASDWHVA